MTKQVDLTPDQAIMFAAKMDAAGETEKAEDTLRAVLKIEPDSFNAQNVLGGILARKKSYYEALYRFDRALKARPSSAMATSNRGMVLGELGHHREALLEFRKAVTAEPKNPVFWNNLGNTQERVGEYESALSSMDHVLRLDPGHALTHFNRGIVLSRTNRREEAIKSLNKAIELNPDNADAYYNRGLARLALGDLKGGFADYEWRLKTAEQGLYYVGPFTQPQWAGEPLSGKTILVHAEQGIGDTIQFLRYVPMLQRMGANVILIVHTALRSWCSQIDGVTVLDPGDKYPPFDFWSPLLSLPHVLGTEIGSIPASVSPLVHKRERHWPLKVGVCWSGNWQHKNDRNRSIPFRKFAKMFATEGCEFYSLQKEIRGEDAADFSEFTGIVDLSSRMSDFNETAKLMMDLDLVVTVDTSVAHMAGTIGIPTWVLLPAHGTDWRWLVNKSVSPWYPTVGLFRQRDPENWSPTISEVKQELKALADRVREGNNGSLSR